MAQPLGRVAALILGAGRSSRMGEEKLLLELNGLPLITHPVSAALAAGCDPVIAVVRTEEVAAAVPPPAVALRNPEADEGMASSIRLGLESLPAATAAALLLQGDQPLVTAAGLRQLIQRSLDPGSAPALASSYRGGDWRPPVLVKRILWPRLLELRGEAGARAVIDADPGVLEALDVPGSALDVDTPEDYERLLRTRAQDLGPAGRQ